MTSIRINNVGIRGVAACVPAPCEKNADYPFFSTEESRKFIDTTGVRMHRIAPADVCTSDMCYTAAKKLLDELSWAPGSVDLLLFISSTPDYIFPNTACLLQHRLNLQKSSMCFDMTLGCSGWIYGMTVASQLLSGGYLKRALILVGDTISKTTNRADKIAWPLFGDSGSATVLEYMPGQSMYCDLGTDGSGANTILLKDGGFRNPVTMDSFIEKRDSMGNVRNGLQIEMNGVDVFSFGLMTAPKSIRNVLNVSSCSVDDIDVLFIHQANKFMTDKIIKKIGISPEKVPYCLDEYGNTGGSTIPLNMVARKSVELSREKLRLLCCAFGVGLSWGSIYLETDRICVPDLIVYDGDQTI